MFLKITPKLIFKIIIDDCDFNFKLKIIVNNYNFNLKKFKTVVSNYSFNFKKI